MARRKIIIRSFNGLGDLLFLTPTLRCIKGSYPESEVVVNTNCPELLKRNPFVDLINESRDGVFLGYADPIHCRNPTMHHILADWQIVCREYDLSLGAPALKPEIYTYIPFVRLSRGIGVQVMHKGHWDGKKVWPYFEKLIEVDSRCTEIPKTRTLDQLVHVIASFTAVVCAEGGISHIAKAIGVPAIVIYGGFAKPEWNGYEDQINLCNPLECSYCYNPKPCVHEIHKKCMKDISIEKVVKEIDTLWID